jgi:hypothetical protein
LIGCFGVLNLLVMVGWAAALVAVMGGDFLGIDRQILCGDAGKFIWYNMLCKA